MKKVVSSSKNQNGQVLIIAIIFMAVILILSAAMLSKVGNYLRFGANSVQGEQAIELAEAGVDNTIWQLNKNGGICPAACTNETQLGAIGTFKVTVVDNSLTLKTVTSTGYVPNSTNPKKKRTIKVQVQVDNTQIAFHYAAQTGDGGLYMSNSAYIDGSVYSNGNIYWGGTGNSMIINGAAYAAGPTIQSPPITVNDPPPHPNASPQPLPTVDYAHWEEESVKTNDIVTCSPTCVINSSQSIGPRKYVGDVTIQSNVTITVTGPIWVTGNFAIGTGNATVKPDPGFGSNGVVLLVGDPANPSSGKVSYTQGGTFETTGANPPGYILVVARSKADDAITIAQSGATAIFYALDGGATLTQSASVAALASKKVIMTQTASLHFITGLGSTSFSSGPGGAWVIKKGTYKQTLSL